MACFWVLVFTITVHAVDFDVFKLQGTPSRTPGAPTLGIYSGSFDPLHRGHEDVIQEALNHFDFVFVNVDSGHNLFKPFRTPHKMRLLGVGKAFENHPRVITSSKRFSEIRSEFVEKGYQFSKIMGSDLFVRRYNEALQGEAYGENEISWLVSWRNSELMEFGHLQKLTNLELKNQETGSSFRVKLIPYQQAAELRGIEGKRIQELVRKTAEVPQAGDPIQAENQLHEINVELRKYLSDLSLAWLEAFPFAKKHPESLSRDGFRQEALTEEAQRNGSAPKTITFETQVSRSILEVIQKDRPLPPGVQIVSAEKSGVQGISGNLVYFVQSSEKLLYVAKVFVTQQMTDQFDKEIKSIQKLGELPSVRESAIGVVGHARYQTEKGNPYFVLVLEAAPGQMVQRYVTDYANAKPQSKPQDNPQDENDKWNVLIEAMEASGRSLAKLHSSSASKETSPVDPKLSSDFETSLKKLATEELSSYLPYDYSLAQFKSDCERALQGFVKHPGYLSWNHGDSNPNNFFYEVISKKFTFIDTGALMNSTSQGKPKAYPARDFYQFLSSLFLNVSQQGYSLTQYELQKIRSAFILAYDRQLRESKMPLTPESKRFFQVQWATKSISFDLKSLEWEVNPGQIEFLKQDIRRALHEIRTGN